MAGKDKGLVRPPSSAQRSLDNPVLLLVLLIFSRLGGGRRVASAGPVARGSWMNTHLSTQQSMRTAEYYSFARFINNSFIFFAERTFREDLAGLLAHITLASMSIRLKYRTINSVV